MSHARHYLALAAFLLCAVVTPLSASATNSVTDLTEFIGGNFAPQVGYTTTSAGDVDGDGYDDILVGAWLADFHGENSGAVFLVYGSESGITADSLESAARFEGPEWSFLLGTAIAGAGDVNNDGYSDFLIGSGGDDTSFDSAGAAYLFYGQPERFTSMPVTDGVVFTGEAADDSAGVSVAFAGDVNNDGFTDIVIGAYLNDDAASGAGAAYLIYGQSAHLTSASLSTAIELTGEVGNDHAGVAVSAAGDVDHDTFDDFLVGANANDDAGSNAGAAYLIYGQSSHLASGSLSAAIEFTGEASSDSAGVSVAPAGDVDHDTFDDFLVGATGNDDGGNSAGAAYLIYGQSSDLTSASLSTKVEFAGEVASDGAATAVAPAGDVNNDTYDDFLVGAVGNDDGGNLAGSVYLVYGQSSDLTSVSLSTKVEFTGEAAADRAGKGLGPAGDVNGDGLDDFLVASYSNDDGGADAGAVYLFLGQPSAFSSASLSTATVEITGFDTYDYAADVITSAGDVNGDGFEDMLIGVSRTDNGTTYLVYGSSEELGADWVNSAVQFTGEVLTDYAGYSVSSAGDVNNDGFDDILIGAPNNDDGGNLAGAAYLIYGQSAALTSASLSTAVEFTGEVAGDEAGYTVSSAGDVNGDSFDDFLVGAAFSSDSADEAGAVYLIYGQSAALTSASLSTAVEFTGENEGDNAGSCIVSAGDINGDGFDDFLISAPENDDAFDTAGAVYLIYGQSAALTSASLSTKVEFTGESESDTVGYTRTIASGDINGDGYNDILIGSPYHDVDVADGVVYILYGQTAHFASTSLSIFPTFAAVTDDEVPGTSLDVGDINGDGYDDVVVGATGYSLLEIEGGATYILYGQSAEFATTTTSEADVTFTGLYEQDQLGMHTAVVDLNGDGMSELVASGYRDGNGPAYVGYLYVDADGDGLAGDAGLFTGADTNDNDADNDGTETEADCNDADDSVATESTYYADTDDDGLGDPDVSEEFCATTAPDGYASNGDDFPGESVPSDTDPGDPDLFSSLVDSVEGTTAGQIIVHYSDDTTQSYTIFDTPSASKVTKVESYNGTGYVLVLHPKGKKLSLVNVYSGLVLDTVSLTTKTYKNRALKIVDLRGDDSFEAVVTMKKGKTKKAGRVVVVKVNTSTESLKKKDAANFESKKVRVNKTKKHAKKLYLRSKNSNVIIRYTVTKKYHLNEL